MWEIAAHKQRCQNPQNQEQEEEEVWSYAMKNL